MSFLRTVFARIRALRRSARADSDLDDELRAYVDARAAAYERKGLAPAEARRAALIEIEGVEQVKERVRDVRIGSMFAEAARDARYGARALWRSPGYAAVVIMTIALGIGVNAAIFSVVHAVLWRPLPYPDAARIVAVEADTRALPSAYSSSGTVFDVRAQSRLITTHCPGRGPGRESRDRRRDGARRRGQGDRRSAAAPRRNAVGARASACHLGRLERHRPQGHRHQPRAVATAIQRRSSSDRPASDAQQLRRADRGRHAARLSPRAPWSEPRRGACRRVVA